MGRATGDISDLMYRELLFQGVIGSRLHGLPSMVDGDVLARIRRISIIQKIFISMFIAFMYLIDVALIRFSMNIIHGSNAAPQIVSSLAIHLNAASLSVSYPLTVFSYTLSILLIDTLQLLYSIRGTYLIDFFLVLPLNNGDARRSLLKSTLRIMDAPLAVNIVISLALSLLVSHTSFITALAAILYAIACFSLIMTMLTRSGASMGKMIIVAIIMIGFLMIGSFMPLIIMEYTPSISLLSSASFPWVLIKYLPIINLASAQLSPSTTITASIIAYAAMAVVASMLMLRLDYRPLFIEGIRAGAGRGSMSLRRRGAVSSMLIKELKAIYRSSRLLMMAMVPVAYGIISLIMVLIIPYRLLSPRLALMTVMPFELMISIVTVMIVYLSYIVDLGGYYLIKMLPLGRGKILESKVLLAIALYLLFTSPLLLDLIINASLAIFPIILLEALPIIVGAILLDTVMNGFLKQLVTGTLPLFMIMLVGLAAVAAVIPLASAVVLFYVSNERAALIGMGVLSIIELAVVLMVNALE
ncbi:MAG: hypothetical protein RXO28_04305 [Thermocladium sp.]